MEKRKKSAKNINDNQNKTQPHATPNTQQTTATQHNQPSNRYPPLFDHALAAAHPQTPTFPDDAEADAVYLPHTDVLPAPVLYTAPDDTTALPPPDSPEYLSIFASALHLVAASTDSPWSPSSLVHPAAAADNTPSPTNHYHVRLFEQGAWRLVAVDDTVPVHASSHAPLTLLSGSALWPVLLTKALRALDRLSSSPAASHASTVLRLSGRLPESIHLTPSLSPDAAWRALSASAAADQPTRALVGLTLPADASDASLSHVGFRRSAMLAVLDAREVNHKRYVRAHSELVEWLGALRDTDEASWSNSLASALGWKRLQRLRRRAAGERLSDFWMLASDVLKLFSHIHVFHAPGVHTAAHSALLASLAPAPPLVIARSDGSGGDGASAPPAAVPVHVCVQSEGAGDVVLTLRAHDWSTSLAPPPLLVLRMPPLQTLSLLLERQRPYSIEVSPVVEAAVEAADETPEGVGEPQEAEESTAEGSDADAAGVADADAVGAGADAAGVADADAVGADADAAASDTAAVATDAGADAPLAPTPPPPPAPTECTLVVSSSSPLSLGTESTVLALQGVHATSVGGQLPELAAGEWALALAVAIKPRASKSAATAASTVSAVVSLPEGVDSSAFRLCTLDEASNTVANSSALRTGAVAVSPSGITVLVDTKPMAAFVPSASWEMRVLSQLELEVSPLPLRAAQELTGAYSPNSARRLFSALVANGEPKGTSASAVLHASVSDARLVICLRLLRLEGKGAVGSDSPTVVVRETKGIGCVTMAGIPVMAGGKGDTLVECIVDEASALELSLPSKPARGDEETDSNIEWRLCAVSAASVALTRDTSYEKSLEALRASWEATQPGRAARAKQVRDEYLAAAAAEAEAARVAIEAAPTDETMPSEPADGPTEAGDESTEAVDEPIKAADEPAEAVAEPTPSGTVDAGKPRLATRRLGAVPRLLGEEEAAAAAQARKDAIAASKAALAEAEASRVERLVAQAAAVALLAGEAKEARKAADAAFAASVSRADELRKRLLPAISKQASRVGSLAATPQATPR